MADEMLIEVDPEGAVKITVKGHKGKGCHKVSEAVEKALGRMTNDRLTGDYYVEQKQAVKSGH